MIRSVEKDDAKRITEIYNHYVLNSIITFEESKVASDEMKERIDESQKDNIPWLVYEDEGRILGYAYANKWKSRCAYKKSLETTIYLDPEFSGRGIGTELYERLVKEIAELEYHTVIGGIALPNDPSIRPHEKLGFKKIGHFEEVGNKFGKFIDVGYWQKKLNQ